MLSESQQQRLARDVRVISNQTRVPAVFVLIVVGAVVFVFAAGCVLAFLHALLSGFTQ